MGLVGCTLGQADTQANTKSHGENDEDDNQSAPPLELAAAAGVVSGRLDLLITLVEMLNGLLGVTFSRLDDGVLLLDNGGELLVENCELADGLLNALQLVVTSAHVAQD